MVKFGIKEITPDNWLEQDEVLKGLVCMSPDGGTSSLTSTDYWGPILAPQLLDVIPEDIQKMFEVARGAMVYGYFFYPLYTLATEQLFRVADAAVIHKCNMLGAPKSKDTFEKRVDWLAAEHHISDLEGEEWHNTRVLRNMASHRNTQTILPPFAAVGWLETIARQINSLFG